jgi:hypothetical protein
VTMNTADIIAASGVLAIVIGGLFSVLFAMRGSIGELKQAAIGHKDSIVAVHKRLDEAKREQREADAQIHRKLDTLIDDQGAAIIEIKAALEAHDIPVPHVANGRSRG